MKRGKWIACLLLVWLSAGNASTPLDSSAADSSSQAVASQTNASKLPEDVSAYASLPIANGQICVAGVKTDDDGMNQKPVVYLAQPHGGFAWNVSLPLPTNTYQARATHCIAAQQVLLVLVQGDTQSEQSLSQTLLQVVELDRRTGKLIATKGVSVPNVTSAYTEWVEKDADNFSLASKKLVIKGQYALLSNRDQPSAFTVQMSQDLNP